MNGAVVSLTALEKDYGTVGAVRGVSLDVGAGEFLTLLGPSGSGKTTTLMMIAGFESPSAGDITIDGRSVVGVSPHKRNIGMVFQNYALFPHLTVTDNIGFPLKQRGIGRAERARMVAQALDLVRLPGYGDRYPRQLSGGQQQRVALARAIVLDPRLLLMDEPLGALDKQLRESLQLEMRRLHADLGITFIYVTHDQEEALTMSDRIAVMNEGRIAQLGRPEDLYDRPCNRFVASFLGESNFLPGIVHGFQGEDIVVAACGGTMVRAVAPSRPVQGDKVMLTMRPERMRFADGGTTRMRAAEGGASLMLNRLQATVTEAVFAGERCRYLLQAPDGTPMVLKEPSGSAVRRRVVGEMAEIAWAAADTVIVEAVAASGVSAIRLNWRWMMPGLLVAPLLVFMLVFYVLPVLAMLLRSVAEPSWTLGNYAALLDDTVFLNVFWTTLRTAVAVTFGCLLLGYPVALTLVRPGRTAVVALIVVLLPFWTSILVRSYAWMVLLGRRGLLNEALVHSGVIDHPLRMLNTPIAVHIAMIHILLPYMILPIANALRQIDPSLSKAALGLGATPYRVFREVVLPLSMPGVAAGVLLVFVLSLGFYITPALVGGPRDMTVSMLIAQQVDQLNWPYAACLSTALLATTLGIMAVFQRLFGVGSAFRLAAR